MMEAKITKVWTNEVEGASELRVDWDNDRHHALRIPENCSRLDVAFLLYRFSVMIKEDKHLLPNHATEAQK